MKRSLLLLLSLLFVVLLPACGDNDAGEAEIEEPEMEETQTEAVSEPDVLTRELSTPEEIEDWVAELAVMVNQNEFQSTSPKEVTRGDTTYQVTVLNPEGRIKIVRAGSPSWENMEHGIRYLTRDGDVIMLEELEKVDDGYRINRFYYSNGELVSSTSRRGATLSEAMGALPTGYESPTGDGSDVRLKYEEVKSASDILLRDVVGE